MSLSQDARELAEAAQSLPAASDELRRTLAALTHYHVEQPEDFEQVASDERVIGVVHYHPASGTPSGPRRHLRVVEIGSASGRHRG